MATRFCPDQGEDLFIVGEALPDSCPLHGGVQQSGSGRIRF